MLRTVSFRTCLVPVLVALLCGPAAALTQYDVAIRHIDEYASAAADRGFSGTVLVSRGAEVLLNRGYGLADRERDVPVTTGTLFDIGSITKDLTRSSILLLSDEGTLSLDDALGKFFDEVPADKTDITVEQLLRHSAGLAEYHDTRGDFEPMTRQEAIERILAQRLRFEPGSDTGYSNSGYTLLAAIIENVSGQSYPDFLRDNIWKPTGMTRTGFYRDSRWGPDEVALGYDGRPGPGNSHSPREWPEIGWAMMGNGGMVTSAEELFLWLKASNLEQIVAAATLDRIHGPKQGSGLVRRDFFYAGGSDFGFIAAIVGNAERNTMVIVTGNTGGQPEPAGNWGLPASETGRALSALLDTTAAGTQEAARDFIANWFTDEFRDAFSIEQHVGILRQLQALVPDPEIADVVKTGSYTARMTITSAHTGESVPVTIELESSPPYRIASMQLGE